MSLEARGVTDRSGDEGKLTARRSPSQSSHLPYIHVKMDGQERNINSRQVFINRKTPLTDRCS